MNNISVLRGLYSNITAQVNKNDNNTQIKSFEEFSSEVDSFIRSGKYEENDYENFLKSNNIDATKENVDDLRECVDYVRGNDESDIESTAQEAESNEVDINKIDVEKVSKLISGYKSYRNDSTVSLSFDDYAKENPEIYSNLYKYRLVKALISNGMAVTNANLSLIENADKKLDGIMADFSEQNAIEAVKSGEISVERLYTSKHTNAEYSQKMDDKQWTELEGEVSRLFERENIEDNDENRRTARIFIDEEIPLTKENIDVFNTLRDNSIDRDSALDNMAKAVARNQNPERATLYTDKAKNEISEKYEYDTKIMGDIKTAHLQYMYEKNIPYTLDNISSGYENSEVSDSTPSESAVKAKLQLAEIQLRLTKEASVRLAGKGIDINTKPLEKAIDELKKAEKEIYAEKLDFMDAEPSNENIQTMAKVFDSAVLFGISRNNSDFSIPYSYSEGKITATLNALSTQADTKYGDSFSKVSEQFGDFLENMGIEPTDENIKAGKILSRNNQEITFESITDIKTINTKVSTLYEKLSPYVVAKMIKDGINPLETGIDDMLEYAENFDEEYYMTDIEKTAQYIVDLNSQSEYTEQEKTAVTAFYRALSTASKYGFASIGNVFYSMHKITVGSLMDGTKNFEKIKRNDVDFKIDDTTDIKSSESEIKAEMERAVSESESTALNDFYDALVKNIINSGNPSALREFAKDGRLSEKTLEEIATGLSQTDAPFYISETKMNSLRENIAQMKNISEDTVNWLKENNIPLTINNLSNMAQFISDSYTAGKKLEKLDKALREKNITSVSEIEGIEENQPYEISESIVDMTDDILSEVISSGEEVELFYRQLEGVKDMFNLQKSINQNAKNVFQIPYKKQNGEIASLNMYVSDIKGENINAFVSLETKTLGNISAFVEFEGSSLNITITSDDVSSKEYLENLRDEFESEFSEFNINELSFDVKESENIFKKE